jgi:hypothetical protein
VEKVEQRRGNSHESSVIGHEIFWHLETYDEFLMTEMGQISQDLWVDRGSRSHIHSRRGGGHGHFSSSCIYDRTPEASRYNPSRKMKKQEQKMDAKTNPDSRDSALENHRDIEVEYDNNILFLHQDVHDRAPRDSLRKISRYHSHEVSELESKISTSGSYDALTS